MVEIDSYHDGKFAAQLSYWANLIPQHDAEYLSTEFTKVIDEMVADVTGCKGPQM